MSAPKVLFGFHAVGVRLRTAPESIVEIYVDPSRKDARMRQFLSRAQEAGVRMVEAEGRGPALLLVLDGVTDPHNLGACLRVADGAGAHAVIAPKDHAVGINATVAKVASGAAETVPYFMVTNLARTLGELKERQIWCLGLSDEATQSLYQADLKAATALVLGAEGAGLRQLTRKTCDALVSIPMLGAVESLNVSVASGICLYEAVRQRQGT